MVLVVLLAFFSRYFEIFNKNILMKTILGLVLRFFNLKVFYSRGLNADLIAIKSVSMPNLKINVTNKNNEQKAYFAFGINRFFDYYSLSIEFLTIIFYLKLD